MISESARRQQQPQAEHEERTVDEDAERTQRVDDRQQAVVTIAPATGTGRGPGKVTDMPGSLASLAKL